MARPKKKTTVVTNTIKIAPTLTERLQSELYTNKSWLNLGLGLLIVLVAGFLVFSYFQKPSPTLGPSQTVVTETKTPQKDVEVGKLPGSYTIKQGDTLFLIAQKYYNDGWQYQSLAAANKITDVNLIEIGQVINIPSITTAQAAVTTPTSTATTPTVITASQAEWGPKISGDTYTVVAGDWLSTIAARAYGDVYSYDKLAKANNITDPNLIEPGTVLQIPR